VEKREPPAPDAVPGPARLPRGRHGLPRELVAENQRERLIAGMIEAVAEHGFNETTITTIVKAAGVSRPTLYQHFENKEACFAEAYEASFEYVRASILAAATRTEGWTERVRAGLAGLLAVFVADPDLARFFLISPAAVGGEIAERHHEAMGNIVSALAAEPPRGAGELSPDRAQILAGGISRLIERRLNAGEVEELRELLPALSELVVAAFLGTEKALALARPG
jgi:AcrR family transcriptional regulator